MLFLYIHAKLIQLKKNQRIIFLVKKFSGPLLARLYLNFQKVLAHYRQSASARKGHAHPDWEKTLAFQNRLKVGLQTRGRPASGLHAIDNKLKLPEELWLTLRGQHAHARAVSIKSGKETWHFRLAKTYACRLAVNLRVVSKRQIVNLKCQKVLARLRRSTCARTSRANPD